MYFEGDTSQPVAYVDIGNLPPQSCTAALPPPRKKVSSQASAMGFLSCDLSTSPDTDTVFFFFFFGGSSGD
jgi:hypothetical protein